MPIGPFAACVEAVEDLKLLGLAATSATVVEIKAAYKRRILEVHPDKGGDADSFRRVRQAYDRALAQAEKLPPPMQPPRGRQCFAAPADGAASNACGSSRSGMSSSSSGGVRSTTPQRSRSPPRVPQATPRVPPAAAPPRAAASAERPAAPPRTAASAERARTSLPASSTGGGAGGNSNASSSSSSSSVLTGGSDKSVSTSSSAVEKEVLTLLRTVPMLKSTSKESKVAELPTERLWLCLAKVTSAQRKKSVESLSGSARRRLRDFLLQRIHEQQQQRKQQQQKELQHHFRNVF